MSTRKKVIISIIAVLAVIGVTYLILANIKKNNMEKKSVDVYDANEIGAPASNYYMAGTTAGGNVVNSMEQNVYLTTAQNVEEVYVQIGDEVKAGDPIIKLDNTAAEIQLEIKKSEVDLAAAAVETAKRELEKLRNTTPVDPSAEIATDTDAEPDNGDIAYTAEELRKAIIDQEEAVKSAQIEYELENIDYELMRLQTENSEICANFDGIVKSIGDENESKLSNTPYIVVGTDGGYTVSASIGELNLSALHLGDTVIMNCYDTGMEYEGVIEEISDMPNDEGYSYGTATQSFYNVKIVVPDALDLSQGMYMEITFSSADENKNTFYLPLAFVMKENNNYYIMKEVDGRLKKVYVKTGKTMWGSEIEIKSGLHDGDYLAFPYAQNAKEGVKTNRVSADTLYQ